MNAMKGFNNESGAAARGAQGTVTGMFLGKELTPGAGARMDMGAAAKAKKGPSNSK